MTGIGPGFWAAVAASVFSAAILGLLAFGRKAVRRELVYPVQKLQKLVKKEKKKRRKFQREIVARMESYEAAAAEERHLQVRERQRVQEIL